MTDEESTKFVQAAFNMRAKTRKKKSAFDENSASTEVLSSRAHRAPVCIAACRHWHNRALPVSIKEQRARKILSHFPSNLSVSNTCLNPYTEIKSVLPPGDGYFLVSDLVLEQELPVVRNLLHGLPHALIPEILFNNGLRGMVVRGFVVSVSCVPFG